MKRFFSLLLLAALAVTLCACSGNRGSATDDPQDFYDPSLFISFPDSGKIRLTDGTDDVTVLLSNGSDTDISVGGSFTVTDQNGTVGTGTVDLKTVKKDSGELFHFDFAHLDLKAGTYTVTVSYTWLTEGGTVQTNQVSFAFTRTVNEDPDPTPDPEDPQRDVKTTPIASLTQAERDTLAQYLFKHYIPCCYGIFSSPSELSSSSIWISVETLNSVIDRDVSAESHALNAVNEKVKIYYPEADFRAEDVRLYDKKTETFRTSPIELQEYKYLSYEVNGGRITVYYEDVPEDEDADPGRYATTLKNSTVEGYFSFVSTVRVGAVG